MEERELRLLLQSKNGCRVPKMKPVPDIHQMDKLPFTPTPPYNRLKVILWLYCHLSFVEEFRPLISIKLFIQNEIVPYFYLVSVAP